MFYHPLTLTLSPFGERGSRYLPQSAVGEREFMIFMKKLVIP
jgi:hypothetical protein